VNSAVPMRLSRRVRGVGSMELGIVEWQSGGGGVVPVREPSSMMRICYKCQCVLDRGYGNVGWLTMVPKCKTSPDSVGRECVSVILSNFRPYLLEQNYWGPLETP
jgi:hypothetical protein